MRKPKYIIIAGEGYQLSLDVDPEVLAKLSPNGRVELLAELVRHVRLYSMKGATQFIDFEVDNTSVPNQGDDGHSVYYGDSVMKNFEKNSV